MKTNLFIFVLTFSCFSLSTHAQRGKQNTPSTPNPNTSLITLNQEVYKSAIALGDMNTAIFASHALIALKQDTYKDTLAVLYYMTQNPVQSIFLLEPLIKQEQSAWRMELMWKSYFAIDDLANALTWLEKLPLTAENYAMRATCQYQLQREGELNMTLNAFAKTSDELKNSKIAVPGERDPIRASSYMSHILALSLATKNKNKEALEVYQNILSLDPDFITAQENAEALEEILSGK